MARTRDETRRAEIVRIASALFAQKGFKGTTVRDIATASGILSGSLYHHFDSKEAIAEAILTEYYEDLVTKFRTIVEQGKDDPTTLADLLHASYRSIAERRAAVALIQNSFDDLMGQERFARLRGLNNELETIWRSLLQAGVDNGSFRSDIDPMLTWTFIRDAQWVTARWWKSEGAYTIDEVADRYISVIFHGLLSSDPARSETSPARMHA